MIDLLKKTFLTGIGVASLTGEKIEELGRELKEKGKLTQQEGEKFVADAKQKADESRDLLKSQIDKAVQSALSSVSLVRREDITELQAEIEKLRGDVEKLRTHSVQDEPDA